MKSHYKTPWFVLPQHSGWSYLTCSARSLRQQQPMQRLEHDPAKRLGKHHTTLHNISGEKNSKCYPHEIWLDLEHAPMTIILRVLKFHCEIYSDCTALPKHTLGVWLTTAVGMPPSFHLHSPIHRPSPLTTTRQLVIIYSRLKKMQLYPWYYSRRLCTIPLATIAVRRHYRRQ
jgi:hypothetical protein